MFLGQFKLMTEMFHLTHSALHTGLTSTIQHYNKLMRSDILVLLFRMKVSVDTSVDILWHRPIHSTDTHSMFFDRYSTDKRRQFIDLSTEVTTSSTIRYVIH